MQNFSSLLYFFKLIYRLISYINLSTSNMLTIENPVLEKSLIRAAKQNGTSVDSYLIVAFQFFEENKNDELLQTIFDTKKNWKEFRSVEGLMVDLLK